MAGRNQVIGAARDLGLFVAYYNPGDNPSWKFTKKPISYFAISGSDEIGRVSGGASAALLWLEGYAAGRSVALDESVTRDARTAERIRRGGLG